MNSIHEALKDHADARLYAQALQFRPRNSEDPVVDEILEVELTDSTDGLIELAFDFRDKKDRIYLTMRSSDLRRFLKQCTP